MEMNFILKGQLEKKNVLECYTGTFAGSFGKARLSVDD
jgi:hypothetical protein